MNLRALIFDVDGTLADTEEAHRRAFNDAFHREGLDWNWSKPTYAHLLTTGGGKERLARYIDSLPIESDERHALKERIPAIHRTKTGLYTQMVLNGSVALRDGVARLLDEAARLHVAVAIASTTTLANIEALLHATLGDDGIARFAVIGTGDVVRHKKPAPDIYEHVLRCLHIGPQECVAIEDSQNGLHSAKGAGLFTIVTPSYWTRHEDFSAADLVLPSLGSPARPLPPAAAALVGDAMLGIDTIERHLTTIHAMEHS